MRPLVDILVATNARVLAFYSAKWADGPKLQLRGSELASVKADGRKVAITGADGTSLNLTVGKDDAQRAADAINRLSFGSPDSGIGETLDAMRQSSDATEAAWLAVKIVGESNKINKPTWKALRAAAHAGEVPLFIISGGSGGGGALAAFSDRCMIVKAGVMTGFMAGSLGGSRQATFHYSEITGIEFNSGMVSGVLEVLTSSYNGSANKDFWRGTTKSRNADSNDPWTLSNTLPLSKLGYKAAQVEVNELRRLVSASKQVQVVINNPTPSDGGGTLAGELAKLGELRQQGILDEAEFAEAKKAVLARFS